jgi:hypothetical protein
MQLIKLNSIVSMYSKPAFGSIDSKKPVMALSVDKESKNPLRGISRTILKRKGTVDVPGYIDFSKLIIIESQDGLFWT